MKNYSFKTSLILCLFVSLFFSRCSQNSDKSSETTAGSVENVTAEPAVPVQSSTQSSPNGITNKSIDDNSSKESIPTTDSEKIERKLLKEGTLEWETSDVVKTHQKILDAVKKYNAYASNDAQTANEYRITNSMEIRVPANQFDEFINNISKDVNQFDNKKISVLDVTEEFIDVSARIKTKKELEQHYYGLLQRTKSVTEILEVEQQLNNVRNDIESAEGRLKYLKDRISLGTITISFYEYKSSPVGFFGEIGRSFVQGWKGILYFTLGILKIWPFILIVLSIVFFVRRNYRKK